MSQTRYEYEIVSVPTNYKGRVNEFQLEGLNDWAKEGWRVISSSSATSNYITVILERELR